MNNAFGRFFRTGSHEEPNESEAEDIKEGKYDKRIIGKILKTSGKGWGFITTEEMPFKRIYFHWTELNPGFDFTNLRRGMKVEFIPIEVEGMGYRAIKINVVK